MKKWIAFVLFWTLALHGIAQTANHMILDKNSVVKDETGNVYTYVVWQRLLETGLYSAKPDEKGGFVLFRMSEEQIKRSMALKQVGMEAMPKPRSSEVFVEGKKFKGDRFTALDRQKFDIKPNDGKLYVINFWFINCPPCKKEIPELNKLVEKYKGQEDIVFIGVALDNAFDLKNFLRINPFNYHIVADGRFYSEKYGVKSYPTHVIVGKDGLIKFSAIGLASNTVHWIDKVIQEQTATKVNEADD